MTEAKCEELGLRPGTVILDIKPKQKKCYELEDSIKNQRALAAKLRGNDTAFRTNEASAILIDSQADQLQMRYKRECER